VVTCHLTGRGLKNTTTTPAALRASLPCRLEPERSRGSCIKMSSLKALWLIGTWSLYIVSSEGSSTHLDSKLAGHSSWYRTSNSRVISRLCRAWYSRSSEKITFITHWKGKQYKSCSFSRYFRRYGMYRMFVSSMITFKDYSLRAKYQECITLLQNIISIF
jgi:hypothetical protein